MPLMELWRLVLNENSEGFPIEGCQYIDHVANYGVAQHVAISLGEDYTYEVRSKSGEIELTFTVIDCKVVDLKYQEKF